MEPQMSHVYSIIVYLKLALPIPIILSPLSIWASILHRLWTELKLVDIRVGTYRTQNSESKWPVDGRLMAPALFQQTVVDFSRIEPIIASVRVRVPNNLYTLTPCWCLLCLTCINILVLPSYVALHLNLSSGWPFLIGGHTNVLWYDAYYSPAADHKNWPWANAHTFNCLIAHCAQSPPLLKHQYDTFWMASGSVFWAWTQTLFDRAPMSSGKTTSVIASLVTLGGT